MTTELFTLTTTDMVTLYGRTMFTYEDIPEIMQGKFPYRNGKYNGEKWYVLPLPNGRYIDYLSNEKDREQHTRNFLLHYQNYETQSRKDMESWVRFNLHSKEEAEEWLCGEEICSLLNDKGYKTEMWSQLGRIGGIRATKDRDTISIGCYPHKTELIRMIDKIKSSM